MRVSITRRLVHTQAWEAMCEPEDIKRKEYNQLPIIFEGTIEKNNKDNILTKILCPKIILSMLVS